MNAKKILSLVLVVVMSLLALTSCDIFGFGATDKGPTIDDALASLTDTYKDTAGKEITKDFDIVGKVILDGAEFSVTWASSNASVVVKPSAKAGWFTVDLPEENATPVNYKLTATITGADGATATYELALKLPVYQKAVEAVTVLEENTPYKVHIAQMNLAKHLFAIATVSTSSSSGESFIKMTTTLADSVDFYAEIVDGGYKFYIKDGDAKKYVTASVTETVKDEQTKYVKCINFADESDTIFKYNDTLGIWYTTTIYGDYVLGNYGTYETVSMSQAKYFTADSIGNTQYVAKFITAAQAEALEPIVLPIPEEFTSIADANNIAAGLAKDATTVSYYRIKGTITEIQNDYHGNMLIADENGNSILIYGLNSKDGTKYGNMADKPVVGDTITVVSKIKNYGGNKPELENAILYDVIKAEGGDNEGGEEGGEEEIVPVTPPTSVVPAVTGKYHLVMTQVNVNKNLYLTGATANKDYYLATTTDAEGAMLFEIEAVEGVDGAFYIFFMKDDVKTYIEVYANGSYTNLKLTTETPASYYTYDAEYNTAVCELTEGNKFFIGSYQTFETASASAYKYIPENFSIKFVQVEAPKTEEPDDEGDTTVDPLATLNGKYVVNFIMDGIYKFDFNSEAGTVTVVDNMNGLFTGTFNYTYNAETGIAVEGANIVFAVDENGALTVSVGGGAVLALLVDESTDDDDDDSDETTIIEPTEPTGTYYVELSDSYRFVDLFGFKAPEAGTYYFLLPEGAGIKLLDANMPEIDIYDGGGVYSVELEADEVFYFYLAYLGYEFTLTYSNEEIVIVDPVHLQTGENTLTFTEELLVSGIVCDIMVWENGVYKFQAGADLLVNIYDENGDLLGRGEATLSSYVKYTVVVFPAVDAEVVAGDYVLNVVAPLSLNGDSDTEILVDDDMIANGFSAGIMVDGNGALTLSNDVISVESIVDPDGNVLTPNADGSYDVESWTKYTVYFVVAEGTEAGTYTIAFALATAPGTMNNPFDLADTNEVVTEVAEAVYFKYVATANGYLTLSSDCATLAIYDQDWNPIFAGVPVFVMEGNTYVFRFSDSDYGALDTVVTASFEAGEITEDVIKSWLNDGWFYVDGVYQINFADGVITAYAEDDNWNAICSLTYSYTVTMNDDGSLTIVPTLIDSEDNIGADFGLNGATITATEGEYGYDFTYELAEVETPDEPNPDEPVVPADPTAVPTVLDTNGVVNNIALEANTYAYAELYIYGEYVVNYDVEGLVVLVNNMPVESGATFYARTPMMATIVTIYGADYAAVEAAVTVAPYVAPATELVVGENANAVTTNNGELNVEFTAPAAGTYEFAPNANTTLIMETAYGADLFFGVDGDKLTLTLAEGETVAFILTISDFSADSVVTIKKDYDTLTIEQALALGETYKNNTGSSYANVRYYISGIIIDLTNTKYGNCTLTDGVNTITVYGLYDITGANKYEDLDVKPVAGDTVKLLVEVGAYYSTVQIANCYIVEHTAHGECTYSAATCTTAEVCKYCGATKEGSVALDHNFVDGKCDREGCGVIQTTSNTKDVTYNMGAVFGTSANIVSTTDVTTSDGIITYKLVANECASNKDGTYRVYAGKSATIVSTNGVVGFDMTCYGNGGTATIKVKVSNDGTNWTELTTVLNITSSKAEYSVNFDGAYTYIMLVDSGKQVRISEMTFTVVE